MAKKKNSKTEPITLSNLKFLLVSFREGFGMADACHITGNTPQEVTAALESDEETKAKIESAIRAANQEQLKKVSELRTDGKYKEAEAMIADMGKLLSLVTWGQFGTSKDLSTEKFMEAYATVRSPKDIAIGFATPYAEYVSFINTNTEIVGMVERLEELKVL